MINLNAALEDLARLQELEEQEPLAEDDWSLELDLELSHLRRRRPELEAIVHEAIADAAEQAAADSSEIVRFIVDILGIHLLPWQRRWFATRADLQFISIDTARQRLGLSRQRPRNSTRRLLNKKRALTRHYARVASRLPAWKAAS